MPTNRVELRENDSELYSYLSLEMRITWRKKTGKLQNEYSKLNIIEELQLLSLFLEFQKFSTNVCYLTHSRLLA